MGIQLIPSYFKYEHFNAIPNYTSLCFIPACEIFVKIQSEVMPFLLICKNDIDWIYFAFRLAFSGQITTYNGNWNYKHIVLDSVHCLVCTTFREFNLLLLQIIGYHHADRNLNLGTFYFKICGEGWDPNPSRHTRSVIYCHYLSWNIKE